MNAQVKPFDLTGYKFQSFGVHPRTDTKVSMWHKPKTSDYVVLMEKEYLLANPEHLIDYYFDNWDEADKKFNELLNDKLPK